MENRVSIKILFFGCILLLGSFAPILAYSNPSSVLVYDSGNSDMGYAITSDSKGNLIVVGSTDSLINKTKDFLIIKYDNAGKILWEQRYDTGSRDEPYAVGIDSKGDILVTGKAARKFLTLKYSSDGKLLWTNHDGKGSDDGAVSLAIDSKDNVVVTGYSKEVVYGYYTLKYDKNGKMIWRKYWRPAETEIGRAVAIDSEDNMIVLGVATNAKDERAWDDYTFYAFKYDQKGKVLWQYKYGVAYDRAEPYSIVVDSKDNIFFIGFASKNHNYDFYVVKTDKDGKLIWDKTYDMHQFDICYGSAIDSQDNILLTGVTSNNNINQDIYTIKIDNDGKIIWEEIYDKTKNDIGRGVTLDSEGNISVVGSTNDKTWNILTINYKNK